MRVNRRLLFWGVLLVAIGGVLVAADLGAINTDFLTDLIRLWPLAIVAIGISIVLRRTRFSLPAILVAALIPGLVVGAAFAVAPRFAGACGVRDNLTHVTTEQGTFDGPASVSLRSGCGTMRVSTTDGAEWVLHAESDPGRAPAIASAERSLAIDGAADGFSFLDSGRNNWEVSLPAEAIEDLNVTVNAGTGTADLSGADLRRLHVVVNAANVSIDASEATVEELKGVVNAGDLGITLPDEADLVGSFTVNAGQVTVCAPPTLGVRIVSTGNANHVAINGDDGADGVWISPNYRSAAHHADLDIRSNFGAVDFNPMGGCS
jgi:hypothetical protein